MTDTIEDPASRLATLIMDAIEANRNAGTPGITRSQIMDAYHAVGGMGQEDYLPQLPSEYEDATALRVIVTDDDVATIAAPGRAPMYATKGGDKWRPIGERVSFRWPHHENFDGMVEPEATERQLTDQEVRDIMFGTFDTSLGYKPGLTTMHAFMADLIRDARDAAFDPQDISYRKEAAFDPQDISYRKEPEEKS